MAEETKKDQEVVISEEALREAAKYIEEEEGPSKGSRAGSTRSLRGSPWHRPFSTCMPRSASLSPRS